MKLRLLVAFIGGVLLAAASFYLVSGPSEQDTPAQVIPSVVPPEAPAAPPEASPTPAPAVRPAPAPKRKTVKTARRFAPNPLILAAKPAPARMILDAQPPAVPVEVQTPELIAAGSFVEQPPEPRVVMIPEKTELSIRLGERLASDRNVPGDAFYGTLDKPLVVDGWVIAERGARVLGRVADIEAAGKVKGIATLTLELTSVTASDGQRIAIRTARFIHKGDTSKKDDAVKVGIGTVIGAAIGAAAGGGKGAAIGAVSGAAAGGGAVALTRGKAAVLEPETRLSFQLERAVTVTERQ